MDDDAQVYCLKCGAPLTGLFDTGGRGCLGCYRNQQLERAAEDPDA
jgi:protein-arginine kinase activator protein McsA